MTDDQMISDLKTQIEKLQEDMRILRNQLQPAVMTSTFGDEHHASPTASSVHGLLDLGVTLEKIQAALGKAGLKAAINEDGDITDFSCSTYPSCNCRRIMYGGVPVPVCDKLLKVLGRLQPPSITRIVQSA